MYETDPYADTRRWIDSMIPKLERLLSLLKQARSEHYSTGVMWRISGLLLVSQKLARSAEELRVSGDAETLHYLTVIKHQAQEGLRRGWEDPPFATLDLLTRDRRNPEMLEVVALLAKLIGYPPPVPSKEGRVIDVRSAGEPELPSSTDK